MTASPSTWMIMLTKSGSKKGCKAIEAVYFRCQPSGQMVVCAEFPSLLVLQGLLRAEQCPQPKDPVSKSKATPRNSAMKPKLLNRRLLEER